MERQQDSPTMYQGGNKKMDLETKDRDAFESRGYLGTQSVLTAPGLTYPIATQSRSHGNPLTSSIFVAEVWKAPDVAQPYSKTNT